jgi:hypothetical protein
MYRPRDIAVMAEPGRRIPGQARRPDHRDTCGHMLSQVLAQQ